MRRRLFLSLALLGACTHAGAGEARILTPRTGVATFAWRSGFDAGNGELRSTLPTGAVYSGPFAQFRAELGMGTQGTYFIGWAAPAWADDPWYGGPPREWAGVNSAKAVARLEGPGGARMRCKFVLRKPDAGMAGGASGQCQLSETGGTFDVELHAGSARR